MAYDEKSKERTIRYLDKQKQIRFWVKEEEYERFKRIAEKAGYDSLRKFYLEAIEEKIQKIENNA